MDTSLSHTALWLSGSTKASGLQLLRPRLALPLSLLIDIE